MKREDLIDKLIKRYFAVQIEMSQHYSEFESGYYEGLKAAYKDTLSMLAFDTKLLSSESYKRTILGDELYSKVSNLI